MVPVITAAVSDDLPTQRKPVVLIRGLAREQRHWGEFRQLLQQQLPNPVLAVDLPGMGQASAQSSPLEISKIAQQLSVSLSQQGLGSCHLLAMSLGAMVAMSCATLYPQQVASLVLINSSAAGLTPFYQRLNWRCYPKVLQALVTSVAKREQLILQLTANNPQIWQQQLPHWQRYGSEIPVSRSNVFRQLLAASRFKLPAKPSCPVLLLASRADRLVNWQASASIARHWQVPLHLHTLAGHDLALDAPYWVVQHAQQFYQQFDAASVSA